MIHKCCADCMYEIEVELGQTIICEGKPDHECFFTQYLLNKMRSNE